MAGSTPTASAHSVTPLNNSPSPKRHDSPASPTATCAASPATTTNTATRSHGPSPPGANPGGRFWSPTGHQGPMASHPRAPRRVPRTSPTARRPGRLRPDPHHREVPRCPRPPRRHHHPRRRPRSDRGRATTGPSAGSKTCAVGRIDGKAVPAEGLVVASFRHLTSRALDPFPHHHNVVAQHRPHARRHPPRPVVTPALRRTPKPPPRWPPPKCATNSRRRSECGGDPAASRGWEIDGITNQRRQASSPSDATRSTMPSASSKPRSAAVRTPARSNTSCCAPAPPRTTPPPTTSSPRGATAPPDTGSPPKH